MEELICNECKGRKFRKLNESEYECEYCGAVIKDTTVPETQKVVIIQQHIPQPEEIVSPFPPEVSYAGSRIDSMTKGTTGRLVIYPDKFAFIPDTSNIFNRGNLSPMEWKITDIAGYTKAAISMLDIKFKNGDKENFTFTNKEQIIKLLEERRKYWAAQNNDEISAQEIKAGHSAGNIFFKGCFGIFVLLFLLGILINILGD